MIPKPCWSVWSCAMRFWRSCHFLKESVQPLMKSFSLWYVGIQGNLNSLVNAKILNDAIALFMLYLVWLYFVWIFIIIFSRLFQVHQSGICILQLGTGYCFFARMFMPFMKKCVGLLLCVGFVISQSDQLHFVWKQVFIKKQNKTKQKHSHGFCHYFVTDFNLLLFIPQ